MSETGSDPDCETGWLVCEGRVLASLEIPSSRKEKAIGLLGRPSLEGAILIRKARSVHSFGMRFDLDVAFLDADDIVIRTLQLHRHRLALPVWRARSVIEAEAGSFARWDLKIGNEVEIRC